MNIDNIHTIVFDFDGVFTDNKVYVSETGLELVRCDRGDGLAINMLQSACKTEDVDMFILSTEANSVVLARAKKLKLECIHGSNNKLAHLKERLSSRFNNDSEALSGVVYLGNDLNDFEVMQAVGYSYAPTDAHEKIKSIATQVLPKKGGEGFVREFVERFFWVSEESTPSDETMFLIKE